MSVRIDHHTKDFVSFTITNYDQSFPNYPTIDFKNILKTYSKGIQEEEISTTSVSPSCVSKTTISEKDEGSKVNLLSSNVTNEERMKKDDTNIKKKEDISDDEEEQEEVDEVDKNEETQIKGKQKKMMKKKIPDEELSLVGRSSVKRNRCENIIERLERKYCGSILTKVNSNDDEEEDEEDDDLDDDERIPNPPSTSSNSTAITKPSKKRKKTVSSDYYDMDDPFIDDSDNIATVETQIKMNKIQTKHDGYFVSSGILEINTNPSMKLIPEIQKEEALTTISNTYPDISKKLQLILQNISIMKSSHEINLLKKSLPGTIINELHELDLMTSSHNIDILRYINKTKSPYRIWVRYLFQIISQLCSEEMTEDRFENFLQLFKKQIMKKRNSNTSSTSNPKESGSSNSNLRQILDQKIQEVGKQIRNKIIEKSSEEKVVDQSNSEGGVDHEKEEEKSSAEYKWVCKWDMSLRGQVYELEQLCRLWVENENTIRQSISTTTPMEPGGDKKRKSSDHELLSPNSEITKVFTELSSIAFALPYSETTVERGGISGIRKALTTEKIRLKNREKRQQTLLEQNKSPREKTIIDIVDVDSTDVIVEPPIPSSSSSSKKEKKRITPVAVIIN